MSRPVRVRFAPSPTGPLHIGGVRTALYNYLFARKHKGTFILRLEDTDQTRFVPGAEAYIKESLAWLGIEIDEGPDQSGPHSPYRQSERKPMYRQYAEQLIDKGLAYYAFDTTEELEEMRKRLEASNMQSAYDAVSRMSMKNSLTLSADEVKERLDRGDNYVIRIKLPRKEEVRFHDIIRGWVVVSTNQMDDKVLLKGDGMPTYHLANVVDDYIMGISHVIRGEEWLPSAPLHVMLYRFLGWEDVMPEFAHLPLLLKPEGNGKLSKRDGDRLGFPVFPLKWTDPKTNEISSGYREAGYFPEAVLNMLALLGWHPSDNREHFSMDELIEAFTLEKVSKSGAKFDVQKAFWFNQQYLQRKPLAEVYESVKFIIDEKGYDVCQEYVEGVIAMMREKVQFAKDTILQGTYFFEEPSHYDEAVVQKKWNAETNGIINKLADAFGGISETAAAEDYENLYKSFCESEGIKPGNLLQPLRVVVSGEGVGAPIWEMIAHIGRDYVINRMRNATTKISFSIA
jgi:glutamyl-tRNA synthetase